MASHICTIKIRRSDSDDVFNFFFFFSSCRRVFIISRCYKILVYISADIVCYIKYM